MKISEFSQFHSFLWFLSSFLISFDSFEIRFGAKLLVEAVDALQKLLSFVQFDWQIGFELLNLFVTFNLTKISNTNNNFSL